jgi:hypothetical protein
VSKDIFHKHELVHAVSSDNFSLPTAINEGLAEVFDDPTTAQRLNENVLDVLLDFNGVDANYPTAMHFTQFLVDVYGMTEYLAFLKALEDCDDLDTINEASVVAFFTPIEDLIAEYLEYPECNEITNKIAVPECGAAPQEWSQVEGETFEYMLMKFEMSCESMDVKGPRNGRMWSSQVFEVEHESRHCVQAVSDSSSARIDIVKCAPCSASFISFVAPNSSECVTLSPGEYYVRVEQDLKPAGEVSLLVSRL